MHSQYLGKDRYAKEPPRAPDEVSRLDDIFSKERRSMKLALEIFGYETSNFSDGKKHYRSVAAKLHPDRNVGGDDRDFKRFVAAWEYICFFHDWD